jgi:hypothetical protein
VDVQALLRYTAVSPKSSPIRNDGKIPAARGKSTSPLFNEVHTDGISNMAPGDIGSRHLSRSFVLLRSPLSNDVAIMNALGEVRRFGRGDGYMILILTGVSVVLL